MQVKREQPERALWFFVLTAPWGETEATQGKHQGQSLGGERKGNRGQIPYCGFCGKAGQEGLELITLNNFKCLWAEGLSQMVWYLSI